VLDCSNFENAMTINDVIESTVRMFQRSWRAEGFAVNDQAVKPGNVGRALTVVAGKWSAVSGNWLPEAHFAYPSTSVV
jgi:hypothetical protein